MHSDALRLVLPPDSDRPGLTLLADLYRPASAPRALLFCLAGGGANRGYFNLGAAGNRAFSFAEPMTAAGFAVAAIDIPGVGGSDTPTDFDHFSPRDAAAVLHAALMVLRRRTGLAVPVIGLGHSMGGCVGLRALQKRNWFSRAVLTSPMLDVNTGRWPKALARRATAVPITSIWLAIKGTQDAPVLGAVTATWVLGICCVAVGIIAALALDETFHRDLDYLEH
jgi:pimeloyl-ACP methyl ester carboxylesterase